MHLHLLKGEGVAYSTYRSKLSDVIHAAAARMWANEWRCVITFYILTSRKVDLSTRPWRHDESLPA